MKRVKETWQDLFVVPEGYAPQDEKVLRRCSSALKVGSTALIVNAASVGVERLLHVPNEGVAESIRSVQENVASFAAFGVMGALIFRGAIEALNPTNRG
jgi:hypothetical protein